MKYAFNPVLGRKKRFLFKEYTDGTIRYDITDQNNTKILGKIVGQQILDSFKNNIPIKGLYVFGRIGMGKTVFSTEVIKNFESTEDLLIDVKHKIQYRYYDTYPKCYHIDYYDFLHDFKWKEKIELKTDEMIIAEWSDFLPKRPINYFENDRIEIELYHCFNKKDICTQTKTKVLDFNEITKEGSMRFGTIIGYGNGIQIVENIKQNIDVKQFEVDPKELD